MAIRVSRFDDPEGCELDAQDHRGELYRLELDCTGGMVLQVVLCRHHVRMLRNVVVEV